MNDVTPPRRNLPVASAAVGYGRPPVEARFKKGQSGNPRGRPKKAAPEKRSASATAMDEILIAEALRTIQVRENDQVIEMPMIQAIIRSMGVAGVKGNHRAQRDLMAMVKAAEDRRHQDSVELYRNALAYKDRWLEIFEDCEQRGVPRPDPVPHPENISLSGSGLEVKFNGPISPDDKRQWDEMQARRREALEIVADNRKAIKRRSKYARFLEAENESEQQIADMIGGVIPSEETRRRPGFDLASWRKANGVIDRLKATKRARRAKSHHHHDSCLYGENPKVRLEKVVSNSAFGFPFSGLVQRTFNCQAPLRGVRKTARPRASVR